MARILDGYQTEAIKEAASLIQKGGVVAFPTETVHGLGADAFNPKAVALIFEVKKRPRFDPLIVHIAELSDVKKVCLHADDRAGKVMEWFWPGPLTVVLPKTPEVPDIVTAGLPTVAVRLPSHPVALSLIREARTPIAAPSANLFGYLSPTTAEHVNEQLGSAIEIILDDQQSAVGSRQSGAGWGTSDYRLSTWNRVGVESTIIDLSEEEPVLLRPGGTPLEEIERVIGRVKIPPHDPQQPRSPGQLPHHYSPRTPLKILLDEELSIEYRVLSFEEGGGTPDSRLQTPDSRLERVGLLAFQRPREGDFAAIEVLSPSGDLREAAANLFAALHRLDSAGLDLILAEPVPEGGLGRAIMDRLRRASGVLSRR
ncbi:MAG: L-threonylcarbamoyladenylate synthase [Dehalococcoidia bacterium]|nr:Threonylcarbamoyl-AMP synthase [Chloroflexota bacterium]